VDWAESTMMEADFDERDYEILRDIVSRLGLADVKAFGMTWEDCEGFLAQPAIWRKWKIVCQIPLVLTR
jgi:hypothetical protein